LVDRLDAPLVVAAGLVAMAAGSIALAVLPGIAGYIAAIALLTPGYQLFQAANNTAVMADVRTDQRGVISGVLNLSRNLGLITGASVMGAVFAHGSATAEIAAARPEAVHSGMQITFGVAAALIAVALTIAAGTYRRRTNSEGA
jgi:MFS family permease